MRIPVRHTTKEPPPAEIERAKPPAPRVKDAEFSEDITAAAVDDYYAGGQVATAVTQDGSQEEEDYRDLYLRARAEMANFRRRTEQRAQDQVEAERRRLLLEFLEFADNLERALAHAPTRPSEVDEAGLRRGLEITWNGLKQFFEREGVEPIAAEGRPFDPRFHEAVATVNNGGQPGQVVEEVQRGYRYRGQQLLRPARVVVSR